jgi:hypothetical protein
VAEDIAVTAGHFFLVFFLAALGLADLAPFFAAAFFGFVPAFFPNAKSQFCQNSGVVPVRTIGPPMVTAPPANRITDRDPARRGLMNDEIGPIGATGLRP